MDRKLSRKPLFGLAQASKVLAAGMVLASACQCPECHETADFLEGERQEAASRHLQGELIPSDSLVVGVAAGYVPPQWAVAGDTVVIYEAGSDHIRIVADAFGAQMTDTLNLPVRTHADASNAYAGLEIHNGKLYVLDGPSGGVSAYGIFEKERLFDLHWGDIEVRRFCVVNDSTVAVLNDRTGSPVISLATKEGPGNVMGRAEADEHGHYNRLRTHGWLACDAGNIYWAGYSEPVLAGYELSGKKRFTKNTVDFFDTSGNYAFYPERQGENFWLSPGAIFAASSIAVRGDELWVLVHPNGEERFSLIDAYDSKTGSYQRSYRVPWGMLSSLYSADGGMAYAMRSEVEAGRVVIYRFSLPQ